MIVFREYELLQKSMGLSPMGGLGNIIVRFIYLITYFLHDLLLAMYVVLNVNENIFEASVAMPPLIGYMLFTAYYLYSLIYRRKFYFLLDQLKSILNKSKNPKCSLNVLCDFSFFLNRGEKTGKRRYLFESPTTGRFRNQNLFVRIICYANFVFVSVRTGSISLVHRKIHSKFVDLFLLDLVIAYFLFW